MLLRCRSEARSPPEGMIVLDPASGTTEDVTLQLIKAPYDGTA